MYGSTRTGDRKSTTQANDLVAGTPVPSAMNSKFSINSEHHAETRDNHPSAGNERNFLFASTHSALLIGDVSHMNPMNCRSHTKHKARCYLYR